MNPTNKDLHDMLNNQQITLARIEERQIGVVDKMVDFKAVQSAHEKKDDEQFDKLNISVNNMHKYAASIAGVAAFIGAGITAGIDWFRK